MNIESTLPDNLIRQPNGSYVDLNDVEPRKALAHELVERFFPRAEVVSERLYELKQTALKEMRAHREMIFTDYGLKIGGKEGGFSLTSLCGTKRMSLEVSKQTTFGPELEAAKALIDQFMEQELAEGGSKAIAEIVEDVFRINKHGRLDTQGILNLRRKFNFDDPLWVRAMDAIDEAICRDSSTTYLRFYRVDTERKTQAMVPLDIAKV